MMGLARFRWINSLGQIMHTAILNVQLNLTSGNCRIVVINFEYQYCRLPKLTNLALPKTIDVGYKDAIATDWLFLLVIRNKSPASMVRILYVLRIVRRQRLLLYTFKLNSALKVEFFDIKN